ncbi:hypothetical protein CHARACLAT_026974 [Characodon lateralis]|uniref:Uncharacterized protein n=1 Tax=Characodon lateralis TaxID=208331 RepID=A0ABU7D3X6_9TELE|nr:hypothetical protein [Characodon lateralis]
MEICIWFWWKSVSGSNGCFSLALIEFGPGSDTGLYQVLMEVFLGTDGAFGQVLKEFGPGSDRRFVLVLKVIWTWYWWRSLTGSDGVCVQIWWRFVPGLDASWNWF